MSENEWVNARSLGYRPPTRPQTEKADAAISKLVGRTVSMTDSRLMQFLAEKRREVGEEASLYEELHKRQDWQEDLKKRLL